VTLIGKDPGTVITVLSARPGAADIRSEDMSQITRGAAALLALMWLTTTPLPAHHGTNINYDRSKQWTSTAEVTDFKYSNPHVQLFFDVTDEKGSVTHWYGELLPNPAMLLRNGWTRKRSMDALAPGTTVVVTAVPARAGGDTVLVLRVQSEGGEDLLSLGPPPPGPAAPPAGPAAPAR
jgi:hypothetical protein